VLGAPTHEEESVVAQVDAWIIPVRSKRRVSYLEGSARPVVPVERVRKGHPQLGIGRGKFGERSIEKAVQGRTIAETFDHSHPEQSHLPFRRPIL
jgi:hypothetical protein